MEYSKPNNLPDNYDELRAEGKPHSKRRHVKGANGIAPEAHFHRPSDRSGEDNDSGGAFTENLRPPAAAEFLGVAVSTLARWRVTGEGPRWSRVGPKLVSYSVFDLREFVKARTRQSTSEEVAA